MNFRTVSRNVITEIGFDMYASQPPDRILSSSPLIAKAVTAMIGIWLRLSSSFNHRVTSRPETSGNWMVHQDEIRTVLARQLKCLETISRSGLSCSRAPRGDH